MQDNRENPEYHVIAAISRLRTEKNRPAEQSWPNHVKLDKRNRPAARRKWRLFTPLHQLPDSFSPDRFALRA